MTWSALVAEAKLTTKTQWLQSATAFARSSKPFQLRIEKSIQQAWSAKPTTTSGILVVQDGKFRLELSDSEKTWIIYDGQFLWTVRFASPDFPGKNKVIRLKVNESIREKDFLLKMLYTKQWSDDFTIQALDETRVKLSPKSKLNTGFKNLKITANSDLESLKEITYSDDVENVTTWKLEPPLAASELVNKNKNYFTYKPNPKLDDVEDH